MKEQGSMNRREFFSKTAAGAAAAGMAGWLNGETRVAKDETRASAPDAGGFIKRPLGKTGITLPVVSMGVMNARNRPVRERSNATASRHRLRLRRRANEAMVGRSSRK
jgi:hypothetical protein